MAERWTVSPAAAAFAWTVEAAHETGATGSPSQVLAVADDRGRVWVWIDGTTVVVDAPAPPRRGPAARSTADALAAPMPATVVAVSIAVGDRVAAGDTLLLLEAMKMEVPLRAPHDGRVSAVNCAVGDLVQPGTALVTIAPETES